MKKIVFFLAFFYNAPVAFTQKNFEGVLVYRDNVISKAEGVSNATWKKILHISDQATVFVKDGNFRHTSDKTDIYFFPTGGKAYYKFKGYDTLYYSNIDNDSSTLIAVTKNTDKKMIAGYNCNSMSVQTSVATFTYFYSPSIYMNPELTRNYRVDKEDIFYKETSSLFLGVQQETPFYTFSENCILVDQKAIDASNFDLPKLPQKEMTASSFFKYPEFKGKDGWSSFLSKNVDASIGAKYIKMKKSDDAASQTVLVNFMVSEMGNVYDVSVANKKEVHPKLAEEAMRVVNLSHWQPATVFGETIPYKMMQPITFQVIKQ